VGSPDNRPTYIYCPAPDSPGRLGAFPRSSGFGVAPPTNDDRGEPPWPRGSAGAATRDGGFEVAGTMGRAAYTCAEHPVAAGQIPTTSSLPPVGRESARCRPYLQREGEKGSPPPPVRVPRPRRRSAREGSLLGSLSPRKFPPSHRRGVGAYPEAKTRQLGSTDKDTRKPQPNFTCCSPPTEAPRFCPPLPLAPLLPPLTLMWMPCPLHSPLTYPFLPPCRPCPEGRITLFQTNTGPLGGLAGRRALDQGPPFPAGPAWGLSPPPPPPPPHPTRDRARTPDPSPPAPHVPVGGKALPALKLRRSPPIARGGFTGPRRQFCWHAAIL